MKYIHVMSLTSRRVELVRYPAGRIQESDFAIAESEIPSLKPGEVLVRNTWSSIDPALRLRLREAAPRGYFQGFKLHSALDGIMTVGEVVESRTDRFRPGDVVSHGLGWREYAVIDPNTPAFSQLGALRHIDVNIAPAQTYLGALGGSGITAYAGLFRAAELREGDVVWVSSAAGSVGSLAAQIAKLRGHRVIGSAGSDDKIAYLLDELQLDSAINYRSGSLAEQLRIVAPDGIDVYFDNVGGGHLEAALGNLRRWGRVALCGAISQYESEAALPGPSNLFEATSNDLTLRGFRGSSHFDLLDVVVRELGQWLSEGKLKYRETVFEGLERAPEAAVRMFEGETIGKTLVHIA
jgi:NADPH-dependent curcumin reductase CurA